MESNEALFSEEQAEKSAEMTNQHQQTEVEMEQTPDSNDESSNQNNEIEALKAEIEKLKVDIDDQKDKYLRLLADLDNTKRRNAKERIELIQTAGKDVIVDLLEVLDDTDRAEKELNNSEDITRIREGVSLVFHKLRNRLQGKGLKIMECRGTDFNTDMHEAIAEIPAPNPEMVGKILDVAENGYYLGDKIIRYAKVVVGK